MTYQNYGIVLFDFDDAKSEEFVEGYIILFCQSYVSDEDLEFLSCYKPFFRDYFCILWNLFRKGLAEKYLIERSMLIGKSIEYNGTIKVKTIEKNNRGEEICIAFKTGSKKYLKR